jgi:hypothetical protein
MREQIESGKWLRRIKEVKKKLSGQKPHGSRAGEGSSPAAWADGLEWSRVKQIRRPEPCATLFLIYLTGDA